MENLYNLFLNYLLKPNEWVNSKIGSEGELGDLSRFYFRPDLIIAMVEQAQNIIKNQEMVLRVEAPVKVFGDIHG